MFRLTILLPIIALVAMAGATAASAWRYQDERSYEATLERIVQEVEQSSANASDMAATRRLGRTDQDLGVHLEGGSHHFPLSRATFR